ncbi:hypothetical protein QA641_04535 [Bradyrhizobium sp. CB1650]|uniref:hypothetical protein n=1 Tax=Bradyrhizobium sp. CB1650 TaxID=3039153 RepID=UPI0024352DAD|nr:hypothetical protein [Bradyrhizobium sp. CB1650]WGD53202.1 hypothetical protein QA641_04535 [Bradyrhizobium sp. CB1650]
MIATADREPGPAVRWRDLSRLSTPAKRKAAAITAILTGNPSHLDRLNRDFGEWERLNWKSETVKAMKANEAAKKPMAMPHRERFYSTGL